MISLQRVKKFTAGVTIGLLSLSFLQSPAFAASKVYIQDIGVEDPYSLQVYESAEDRIHAQNVTRDYYKSIPEKTLTVLIAADEQYRKKHPDWKFYTKALVVDGTRDFKEYYNINYVPVQFLEWQSDGKNSYEIAMDLMNDYGSYAQNKMKDTINFSLVVGFTANPNYEATTGGNSGKTLMLGPNNGGKSATMTINDNTILERPIEQIIKHEVSHTYRVPDDKSSEGCARNSVMSYCKTTTASNLGAPMPAVYNPEWSVSEMGVIAANRDYYQNREIKEVTSFNNKLKVNRTGNLFFTEVKSSPQANLGYVNGYAQVDIDIDKKPFADFHMLETVNDINERLNSLGMVGNEITFTKLFNPNAGAANPTDTYKFN
ncbi:TPA: hypothetical protein ROY17_005578 [Bacillus thuringiensis]|nr:hypothetical protein [Bacillus thuringiensis]